MKEFEIINDNKVLAKVRVDDGKIKIIYNGEIATKSITAEMFTEIKNKLELGKNADIDTIVFSESVKDIAARSFDGKKIRKVVVRSSNLESIGAFAFTGSEIEILDLDWKKNPHFTAVQFINADKGLKTISEGAFLSNNIKKVIIPDTVEKIEKRAFAYNQLEQTFIHSRTVENVYGSAFLGNEDNKFYNLESNRKQAQNTKIRSM